MHNKGDISKALRIIRQIDNALALTGDAKSFEGVTPGEVTAISNSLLVARTATKNLLRKVGYSDTDNVGFPPSQNYRG